MTRPDSSLAYILACSSFALLFCPACDQGLNPMTPGVQVRAYGISGTVYFRNWPPQDSVVDLRVVSFKNSPSADILNDVLQGKAGFTPTLEPYGADSLHYSLTLNPLAPGAFAYTAVAQRYGQNINTDWRAVGVYRAGGDTSQPGSIDVPADRLLTGIDIVVDFHHPPPQP